MVLPPPEPSFTVATLNVRGMLHKKKRQAVRLFARKNSLDCLLLQETHGNRKLASTWPMELGKKSCFSSFFRRSSRGAAIVTSLPQALPDDFESVQDPTGRVVSEILEVGSLKIGIVSAYGPNLTNAAATHEEYVEFLTTLDAALNEIETHTQHIVLAGDLNLIFNVGLDARGGDPKTYDIPLDELENLLEGHRLIDCFRYLHPDDLGFTFAPAGANRHGIFRRLDYVFSSSSLVHLIRRVEILHLHFSDHKGVAVTFAPPPVEGQEKKPSLWRHNDLHNKDPDFLKAAQEAIQDALNDPAELDARARWEFCKYRLRRASMRHGKLRAEQRRVESDTLKEKLKVLEEATTPDLPSIKDTKYELNKLLFDEDQKTIFKSRAKWTESGEKCTSYFYRLIKDNAKGSNVMNLNVDGRDLDHKEINAHVYDYYAELYKDHPTQDIGSSPLFQEALDDLPKVDEDEAAELDRPITLQEMTSVLFKKMRCGKAPGNDGITPGLYRTLWGILKTPLWKALCEGLENGLLAPSQRQSIVRLIEKKGKDPGELKNWRPISLLNTDLKILSRVLTTRLDKVIQRLTSPEQLAFIKGKNIAEGTRLIEYALSYCHKKSEPGVIMTIDFAKAFDSVSHKYLLQTLEAYNIPANFVGMVKTLYAGAESAVLNNHFTTRYFPLERSCRQGDSLSPYLFLLALEPLLRTLKRAPFQGIPMPGGGTVKLIAYADDLTVFARDQHDVQLILDRLDIFASLSGLRVNVDKSELMPIGTMAQGALQNLGPRVVDMVKITGIHFGSDKEAVDEANFTPVINKTRAALNMCRTRNLTILGRAMVLKTMALSQVQYLANSIEVPPDVVKQLKKLYYRFLWKGQDKMKRTRVAMKKELGGLNFPILDDLLAATKVQWLRRRITVDDRPWIHYLDHDFKKLGGYAVLKGEADVKAALKDGLLPFNGQILAAFLKIRGPSTTSLGESPVWRNRLLTNRKKESLPARTLAKQGFRTVAQFLNVDGSLIKMDDAVLGGLSRILALEWMAVTAAIAKSDLPRGQGGRGFRRPAPDEITDSPMDVGYISALDNLHISDVKQSAILALFAARNNPGEPPFRSRASQEWGLTEEDWRRTDRYAIKHSIATAQRSFVFRITNGLTYANRDFKRFGVKDSDCCSFCDEPNQTTRHLFLECEEVKAFRDIVEASMFRTVLTNAHRLFGNGEATDDYLLFELNRYLYQKNYHQEPLGLISLKEYIKSNAAVECYIAKKRDLLEKHLRKWDPIRERL